MLALKTLVYSCLLSYIQAYTFTDKSSSYLQYNQWDARNIGELTFSFKTHNSYGLLLYSDNSKNSGLKPSFILIKLEYKKLSVTVQMGSEDYISKKTKSIGRELNDLKWHEVKIKRTGRETTIILDNEESIVLFNDGELGTLDLNSDLYFGGVSSQMTSQLVDRSILALPSRFIGCIKDNIEYDSSSKIRDVYVKEGCLEACASYTCPNNGRCLNHFTKAKCDCIGTGYYGTNCTKVADSLQFKSTDYVAVDVAGPLKSTTSNVIKLRFKTIHPDGLLLAARSGNDHLMLEIHSTIIQLSINLGGGYYISQINDVSFSDGDWHFVEILRKGRNVRLMADRKYTVNSSTPGAFSKFDLRDLLYIGGHPKPKSLSKINSKSQQNFNGCLQQLVYNELDIVYKVLNTRSNRFQIHGTVKKGCTVVKGKNKDTRDSDGMFISKSGPVDPYRPLNTPKITNIITSTSPLDTVRVKTSEQKSSTLSKRTVIWIVIGIIVGFIVLVITIALIVHSIKNRYHGVFVSSKYQQNNNFNKHKMSRTETVIFTPRNGKLIIDPEPV